MRVAMVTPMSPESAIADVMIQAVPDLSEQWELDIWCPTEAEYRTCPVPVHPYEAADHTVLAELAEYDLVIYVLGDSPWHARILPLAQRLPGLVVLHDASLTNLVRHVAIETDSLKAMVDLISDSVGEDEAEKFRTTDTRDGPGGWLRFCAQLPLQDLVLEDSLGAVVHSTWHAQLVDGLTLGSVTVAPLPVPSTRLGLDQNQRGSAARLLDTLPTDAVLVVTVGAVNTNRQVDKLLEAIAADPVLVDRLHLWAVGPVDESTRRDLVSAAVSLGIDDRFVLTGRVSDTLLLEILTRADIAAALRSPVLEGQSASVLTQLLSATPVIVFDHAHYAELPDDVAVKVDPLDAVAEITAGLRLLVDDEAERSRRGERGRDYVLATRSGTAYAERILEAGELALATKPLGLLTTDLASRLRRLDLHMEPALLETVADLTFELFDLA